MAKRAPDAQRLALVAILPSVRAYDDLTGVASAWQQLMDRTKVRDHLAKGGRVHLAVEDRWLVAYPATQVPQPRLNMVRNPRPFGLMEAIAQGLVFMPSPRFEPPC